MYDQTCYYDHDNHDDPNGAATNGGLAMPMGLEEDLKLSSYSIEQHHISTSNQNHPNSEEAAVNFELDHELSSHLMQDNWDSKLGGGQDNNMLLQQFHQQQQIDLQGFNPGAAAPNFLPPTYAQPPTPDLLNLFHLPRFPNSSISFANPNKRPSPHLDILGGDADRSGGSSSVIYDSQLHLDLPQQTPIFKELFHSLPHNHNYAAGTTCYFGAGAGMGMDDRDDGFYQDGDGRQYENSMLNFSRDISSMGKPEGKGNRQHFATERQRREQLNGKYTALRTLVPNPTKADRASIVHDAIEYIKELLRTVDELKIIVDKKRYGTERCKRRKTEDEEASGDMESSSMGMKPLADRDRDQSNGTSRGTWLKRKSKDTEVDVRIIEDEVTIKLIQRKKLNCLLSVSKILDELQLDLHHVSGGNIGNSNCFLFNTKIFEGSSVHACAIANKVIEIVDKNYAAFEPTTF